MTEISMCHSETFLKTLSVSPLCWLLRIDVLKMTAHSKVSNAFASCAIERWRVRAYESAIGTGILEHRPSGVNTDWLAGGTEGIDSATDGQSMLESGLRHASGKELMKRSNT